MRFVIKPCFPTALIGFGLLLFLISESSAEGIPYAWSLTPDQTSIQLKEGDTALLTYTFQNLGTEPIYFFSVIDPIFTVAPDATDFAQPNYAGPVASIGTAGCKVSPASSALITTCDGETSQFPAGTLKFQYFLVTPPPDPETEPPDFGSELLSPTLQLSEGPDWTTDPELPPGSGSEPSVLVTVTDVPEPRTSVPIAVSMFVVAISGWRNRKSVTCSRMCNKNSN